MTRLSTLYANSYFYGNDYEEKIYAEICLTLNILTRNLLCECYLSSRITRSLHIFYINIFS